MAMKEAVKDFVGEKVDTRADGSKRVRLYTGKEGAVQSFKEECDINNVVRKHGSPPMVAVLGDGGAKYGDFSHVSDYQSALNAVISAENLFNQVPADIRDRFANDPGRFLAFVDDPKNADELVRLGLAKRPEVSHDGPVQPGIQSSPEGVKAPATGAPTISST